MLSTCSAIHVSVFPLTLGARVFPGNIPHRTAAGQTPADAGQHWPSVGPMLHVIGVVCQLLSRSKVLPVMNKLDITTNPMSLCSLPIDISAQSVHFVYLKYTIFRGINTTD